MCVLGADHKKSWGKGIRISEKKSRAKENYYPEPHN